jgi:hypothetical protein
LLNHYQYRWNAKQGIWNFFPIGYSKYDQRVRLSYLWLDRSGNNTYFMIALTRNLEVTSTNLFFRFPSIWLRFNCHCLECKQDQTRAKLINPATIDLETTIQATQITDDGINKTLSVIIALYLFIFTGFRNIIRFLLSSVPLFLFVVIFLTWCFLFVVNNINIR